MRESHRQEIQIAARTDVGLRRFENQDCYGSWCAASGRQLLVVADGMGGHQGGATASRMAIEEIGNAFCAAEPGESASALLTRAFEAANRAIHAQAEGEESLRGMGSTGVALLLEGGGEQWSGWVAHAGDSRLYRWRDGQLAQLTLDHSVGVQLREREGLSEAEVAVLPDAGALLRALGPHSELEVEVQPVSIAAGDVFVLCSDGLTAMVSDAAIGGVLARHSPREAARVLVEEANRCGGMDNITVQIAALPGSAASARAPAPAPGSVGSARLPRPEDGFPRPGDGLPRLGGGFPRLGGGFPRPGDLLPRTGPGDLLPRTGPGDLLPRTGPGDLLPRTGEGLGRSRAGLARPGLPRPRMGLPRPRLRALRRRAGLPRPRAGRWLAPALAAAAVLVLGSALLAARLWLSGASESAARPDAPARAPVAAAPFAAAPPVPRPQPALAARPLPTPEPAPPALAAVAPDAFGSAAERVSPAAARAAELAALRAPFAVYTRGLQSCDFAVLAQVAERLALLWADRRCAAGRSAAIRLTLEEGSLQRSGEDLIFVDALEREGARRSLLRATLERRADGSWRITELVPLQAGDPSELAEQPGAGGPGAQGRNP